MSFKVFSLQLNIKKIHDIIRTIAGGELSALYTELVNEALSKRFINGKKAYSYAENGFSDGIDVENVKETNDNWFEDTNDIILAYIVSEQILFKLIWLCENEVIISNEYLDEYAFAELYVIFSTY